MNCSFQKCTAFILFLVGMLGGCKKFVDVAPPANSISANAIFSSEQGAVSAVDGLYSQMTASNLSFTNGGISLYAGYSSDELTNPAPNTNYDPFRTNDLTSDNGTISSNFWSAAYKNIYQANVILEGLSNSTAISDHTKRQLRGEMLFVRAFHYFYLVNLFGDVPYLTTSNYKINASTGRTPADDIFSGITNDLTEAQQLLSESYPTATKARPNKWTAVSLLARVYLYRKDWANAELAASSTINSGRYSLAAALNSVFVPASTETIWMLQRDNSNTADGSVFIPAASTTIPTHTVTNALLNSFESGDNRKSIWLGKNVVGGQDYYYPFKYKQRLSTPVTEFEVVLRLAEMYLIRAEARANQNKVLEALSDLNMVRNRAGLPNSSASNTPALLSAVEHEMQIELFAEWGHRWLDLKRTNRANAVLITLKGVSWQVTDQLYPIPLSEIQSNPALKQNPGY